MTGSGSPLIGSHSWGAMAAGGSTFKDAKLWPGGARSWNWAETGTSHSPGIGIADVEELLAGGAEVVVLSTGRAGRLGVADATIAHLREKTVEVEVLSTDDAIDRYNRLAVDGVAVGALIHTSC